MIGMNKLPAKQIYLLMVIITGIIALSVYSTYAIFTFEGETSDAFNIQLPSVLKIQTDMYEYKQLEVAKNSVQTTDIDLYNTYDYELCYSIWYKVLSDDSSLIDIYELSDTHLSTNGTIQPTTNSRFRLLITNNSNENIKVNIGLAAIEATGTCSLKLSSDKKNIKKLYDKPVTSLSEQLITNNEKPHINSINGSLVYKNIPVDLMFPESITIASEYTIKDKKYQLIASEEILSTEYSEKLNDLEYKEKNYYLCRNKDCNTLYRINEATVSANTDLTTGEVTYNYKITNVDEYEAYNKGESGLKKINQDYYFYGDNPHNFIYYNCQNDNVTSCELWRILGLIYDETTTSYKLKLIRHDSLGNYQYHDETTSNIWSESKLNKYLNEKYQKDLKYLSLYPHNIEELSNLDVVITDIPKTPIIPKTSEVTLMNITDYLYASTCQEGNVNTYTDCLKNNWLNRPYIKQEWTLTSFKELEIAIPPEIEPPVSNEQVTPQEQTEQPENNQVTENPDNNLDEPNNELPNNLETQDNLDNEVILEVPKVIEKSMYTVGNKITPRVVTDELAVRPVVYLQERMLFYSGDGTLDNPYVIK